MIVNEEKIYQFNDYVLSYDKSLSDRSCLTISKIQNGEMYLMGELFDGSADVVNMLLDSLQRTVNYCKQENARLKEERKQIKEYVEKCNFDNAEILYDFGSEYCYIDDFKEHILEILKEN